MDEDLEEVVVRFKVNRASLNRRLGNTPNVTLANGILELLADAFGPDRDPTHGYIEEGTEILGSFEVI